MITHFEVSNFKSLKHLSLDMRRFMVLVGPNGAGKTNLVRALEVFGEVLRRGTVEPIQEHGYDQLIRWEKRPARAGLSFSLQVELPDTIIKHAFPPTTARRILPPRISMRLGLGVTGVPHTNEVTVIREELHLESARSSLEIIRDVRGANNVNPGTDPLLWYFLFTQTPLSNPSVRLRDIAEAPAPDKEVRQLVMGLLAPEQQETIDPQLLQLINWQRRPSPAMKHLRDTSQVKRLRLDASALRREFSSGETPDSLLGPTGEGLATAVARLRGPKTTPSAQFRKVLEALQEVYPRIEDVLARRIPSGHLILLFKERGISEELGQGSVSDGVLHALALLVALHQGPSGQAGLLAIEEPENAIHPWPLRKLIARAQQSSRQIILTTHSETVVNAVTDPENLFLVENDDKRGTLVTQATAREAALKSILEESGQRLGDVWLDGSLGGVPGVEP